MIELLRPCGLEFPDGKQFGVWGDKWEYHFDFAGNWVKGQVDHLGSLAGQHGGVDIICPVGTPLKSPAMGTILQSGWQDDKNQKKGYGIRIILEIWEPVEAVGFLLTIGHFSELFVKAGQKIQRGAVLGFSGETGKAFGPHVHLQLEKPGPYPRMPLNFARVLV
jgi:murein DD-endopeptidase MepM/ murein hydrolase activator NlpD